MTLEERALLLAVAKWMLGLESMAANGHEEAEDRRNLARLKELIAAVERNTEGAVNACPCDG